MHKIKCPGCCTVHPIKHMEWTAFKCPVCENMYSQSLWEIISDTPMTKDLLKLGYKIKDWEEKLRIIRHAIRNTVLEHDLSGIINDMQQTINNNEEN